MPMVSLTEHPLDNDERNFFVNSSDVDASAALGLHRAIPWLGIFDYLEAIPERRTETPIWNYLGNNMELPWKYGRYSHT